ncbi:hypothetical protein CAAN1_17S00584 [[Candida] anglica]|uniref:BOD1/SHG1 domain-containing protein n=1 Tax=[Candida] anglica TaxID=148631 RepID=A0ABP0E7K0_9ASCO
MDSSQDPKHLVSVYKKNGSFDKRRRVLLDNFKSSETHANLMLKLKMIVEGKIKNDPSILMKNRGKVGALIQGNIIQQKTSDSILSIVDKDIQEKIIDSPEFHEVLRDELGDIKRRLMGVSDEDWERQKEEEKAAKRSEAEEMDRIKKEEGETNFSGYKLKPGKVMKAPTIKLGQLKY